MSCLQLRLLLPGCQLVGAAQLTTRCCAACLPVCVVQAVLQYHPGLEFLADTPEFQARYAETVIYRIFYTINRCVCGWGRTPQCCPLRQAETVSSSERGVAAPHTCTWLPGPSGTLD